MNDYIRIALIGLFFGTFGTSIGGLIGILFTIKSQKVLSFILQFAARINDSCGMF